MKSLGRPQGLREKFFQGVRRSYRAPNLIGPPKPYRSPCRSIIFCRMGVDLSSPSGVRGGALEALALFVFLESKIQHLIIIPAPNLLKLTSRKRDIYEKMYVKWGKMTLTHYYTISGAYLGRGHWAIGIV